MRYILVKTQVHVGIPNNTLSLLVLTRTGWVPWSEVEGKTNCSDPELCPVMSFDSHSAAWVEGTKDGKYDDGTVVIVGVDVNNPVGGKL